MDIKEIILGKLEEDPLLKHIMLLNYADEELFPNYILELKKEVLYSSVEVAAMIDENDSTIRNYVRIDSMNDYIKPVNVKRFLKYDYISVFKIHMIFLLKKKQRMLVADIEHILGVQEPVVMKSNKSREQFPQDENLVTKREIYPVLTQMKEMLMAYEEQFNLNKKHMAVKGEIELLDSEVNNLEKDIIKLENHIEIEKLALELRRTNRRNVELVDTVLRKKLQNNTNKSFLQRIFSPKDNVNDVDSSDINKEIELNKAEMDRLTKSLEVKETSLIELRNKVIELNEQISIKHEELKSIAYLETETLETIELNLAEDEDNLIKSK